MLAALIGAGFSKWAVDLPIASELFDLKIELCNQREGARLNSFGKVVREWFAEHPDGHAEEFIASCHERS
jgi:hypothetical protein